MAAAREARRDRGAVVLLRRGGERRDCVAPSRWRKAWPAGVAPTTTMARYRS